MTAFPGFHRRYGFPSQVIQGSAPATVCLDVPDPDVETPVIVPPPTPSYTLAPGVGPLTLGQQSTLDACLVALTGRVGGVFVTSARTTATHHAIELATAAGHPARPGAGRARGARVGRAAPARRGRDRPRAPGRRGRLIAPAGGGREGGRWYTRRPYDDARDTGGLPLLLRAPGPPADPVGAARPVRGRPLGAAHHRGHAAAQVVLPGCGRAARAAHDELPEVLPHERHRPGGAHRPPPHLLRDARQLLDRGLLQGRRDPLRLGAVRPRSTGSTPTGSGSRSSRGWRACPATTRRSSSGSRWAFPATASRPSARPRTSGRRGPTGPCGPNTELYLDRGPAFGPEGGPAAGGDRYLEYWNLVFMQYDRAADGALTPLPSKNIDTGAGLERLAAILQDVPSVFDTDAFRPLIAWAEGASGRRYGADPRADRALRVLADHGRAMTFLATDGVRPSNEGRGYILRRIVRRAVSEASQIGLEPGAVAELAGPVVEGWGEAYPELRERDAEVRDVIAAEAEQFARTLTQGRRLLGEVIERSRASGTVTGDDAFRLHDTYGYPLDLTLEAAQDAGLSVDAEGFERLMEDQRERSRAGVGGEDGGDVAERAAAVAREAAQADFVGWDQTEIDTRVTAMEELGDGTVLLKLERSPFYPEGGGQVSDSGEIAGSGGRATVTGAFRVGDDQVLRARLEEGHLPVGAEVTARVDRRPAPADPGQPHGDPRPELGAARDPRRRACARPAPTSGPTSCASTSPTAGRVPAETLEAIEAMVNRRVEEDQPVTWEITDRDAAAERGRHRPVRGEVRRAGAGRLDRRLLEGALRRHARRPHRRDRPLRDHRRVVDRRRRAAHRGAHRPRRRRLAARAGAPPARGDRRQGRAHPGARGRAAPGQVRPRRHRGDRLQGRGLERRAGRRRPGRGPGHGRAARDLRPRQAGPGRGRRGRFGRGGGGQGAPRGQPRPRRRVVRPVGRLADPGRRPDRRAAAAAARTRWPGPAARTRRASPRRSSGRGSSCSPPGESEGSRARPRRGADRRGRERPDGHARPAPPGHRPG